MPDPYRESSRTASSPGPPAASTRPRPGRDRAVDALRALAILGLVRGHWLVTALVADSRNRTRGQPAPVYLPHLTPVSWVFQTLAVFFLVGGIVAAPRSCASARKPGACRTGRWVTGRLSRLFRPVAAVLVVWTLAAGAMLVPAGRRTHRVRTLAKLALVAALVPAGLRRADRG
ncbi:hypothetical protein SCYAM73S_00698 [Streptomyces cyaneofuscatus]